MFREGTIVKRKCDTDFIWEVTRVYEDREGNEIIDIETQDGREETCYPEQLEKLYS